jgi:hypothetical protein
MKKLTLTLLAFTIFYGSSPSAAAALNSCMDIGGMALAEMVDDTNAVAAIAGSFTGARAIITSQEKTETGLKLGMEHHFISDNNGMIKTKDVATLTAVSGKENVYLLEIDYEIEEAKGKFKDYSGSFHSFGAIKLDQGKIVLRYKGEICK